ncbi:Rpn family recombination-promoting nuclease/putative transposase [Myroides guanonis]|uniref:Transposase (putative) YhgA-like domain-containing protein n=1 Tax=Myroides guanonis TaxID=1150112 RepID=A0A1I3PL30_9FLAO|nr:Rpn family recombination-promoting nuclease/putative transposase [Myroides guanonis]SFJ22060.1 conserved hypothetical protein (putative transposase or invertase) [Myroides guanonis]
MLGNDKAVFDLYCTGEDGEHFIIEMQQISQDFFKDRTVFYTSRLINRLVRRGVKGNTYELPEVYFIGVLEFELDEFHSEKYYYDVALLEKETKEVFYDKLGFKFLIIPNFKKEEAEVTSYMDQWMYTLKNLSKFDKIPSCLDIRVFGLICDIGKVANLNKEDMISYEASLKRKRDAESIRLTQERIGFQKGIEEGMEKGREEGIELEKRAVAIKLKAKGMALANISEVTSLSIEEIEKL